MGHSFPPDPGEAGGYNHNAATTKTGEGSGAEGVKALAENKGSAVPPPSLNSFCSIDFARALAPAPALKMSTAHLWPPDPGRAGAFKGPSWPPDPGGAEATCTGLKSLKAF